MRKSDRRSLTPLEPSTPAKTLLPPIGRAPAAVFPYQPTTQHGQRPPAGVVRRAEPSAQPLGRRFAGRRRAGVKAGELPGPLAAAVIDALLGARLWPRVVDVANSDGPAGRAAGSRTYNEEVVVLMSWHRLCVLLHDHHGADPARNVPSCTHSGSTGRCSGCSRPCTWRTWWRSQPHTLRSLLPCTRRRGRGRWCTDIVSSGAWNGWRDPPCRQPPQNILRAPGRRRARATQAQTCLRGAPAGRRDHSLREHWPLPRV